MTFPRMCRALASSLKVRQGCQPLKSIGIRTVSRHQDSSTNHHITTNHHINGIITALPQPVICCGFYNSRNFHGSIITALPQPGVHSACRGPLISAQKFAVLRNYSSKPWINTVSCATEQTVVFIQEHAYVSVYMVVVAAAGLKTLWDLYKMRKHKNENQVAIGPLDWSVPAGKIWTNVVVYLIVGIGVKFGYDLKIISEDLNSTLNALIIILFGISIPTEIISGVLHSHLRVGVDETHRANVTRFRGSMNTTALLLVSGSLILLIPIVLPFEEGPKYVLGVTGTIGGVAGAFGSRHIVENFSSGIYILVFRPFQIGDHIKVEAVEGKVLTINWSTTKVTNSRNVPVIVPNLVMLGQAIELKSDAVWKEWESEIPINLDDLEKIPPVLKSISEKLKLTEGVHAPRCWIRKIDKSRELIDFL